MASSKLKSSDPPTTFSSATPHFLYVVIYETLKDNKLIMPRKFVFKYGKTLSNEVFVKLPCGSEWKMELRKSGGLAWFQKGWPEFAKHYSIGIGHFLIFEYKGNSRFDAIIFDESRVEINYPIVPFRCNEPKNIEEKDDFIEILEKSLPSTRKRKSSQSCIFRSSKKFRAGPIDQTRLRPKGNHDDQYNVDSHSVKTNNKGKVSVSTDQQGGAGKSISVKVGAFLKTNNLESVENFSYSAVMKESNVSETYSMALPSDFARKFLTLNESYNGILKLVNGWTWLMRIRCRSTHDGKVRDAKFIECSWKKFSCDNDLKVGDTCDFELINRKRLSFKVSIFRGEFKPANIIHLPKSFGNSRAFRFYSTNPFFKLTLKPTSLTSRQRVPASFGKAYFERVSKAVMLKLGTHLWSVNVSFSLSDLFRFSGGWRAFVRENSLCLGDVCVFELINTNDIVLNVTIFRVNGTTRTIQPKGKRNLKVVPESDYTSNGDTTSCPLDRNASRGTRGKYFRRGKLNDMTPSSLAFEAASRFSSQNPFFIKAVTLACLRGYPVIQIPNKFGSTYFRQQRRQTATLKLGTNSWSVNVCCSALYYSFTGLGWPKFAKENTLNAGDFCVYELIKEIDDHIVLKVSVFRAIGD